MHPIWTDRRPAISRGRSGHLALCMPPLPCASSATASRASFPDMGSRMAHCAFFPNEAGTAPPSPARLAPCLLPQRAQHCASSSSAAGLAPSSRERDDRALTHGRWSLARCRCQHLRPLLLQQQRRPAFLPHSAKLVLVMERASSHLGQPVRQFSWGKLSLDLEGMFPSGMTLTPNNFKPNISQNCATKQHPGCWVRAKHKRLGSPMWKDT